MKLVLYLINTCLAALIAYQGYTMFYPETADKETARIIENQKAASNPDGAKSSPRGTGPVRQMEAAVVRRNLFKVVIDQPVPGTRQQTGQIKAKPEKTRLKLTLWGTVEGAGSSGSWAVIEDRQKRRQDLYRIGDQVLGAKIKEISRNQVILTVDGKDQVLEAETQISPKGPAKKKLTAAAPKIPPRPKDGVQSPGDLIQALKSRPYFKEGAPSGVLIYGIRPGSQLLSLGLRNGDIIQTMNGVEIRNSKDLKTATQDLSPVQGMNISLIRRGQEKEINYKGVDE